MSDQDDVIRVGKQVLREHDLKFPITYKGEQFMMRLPAPYERAMLEAEVVRRLGGQRRDAFSITHLTEIEARVYVNELVVKEESPEWYESAWSCFDDALITKLYDGYLRFREKFARKLQEGGFASPSKGSSS